MQRATVRRQLLIGLLAICASGWSEIALAQRPAQSPATARIPSAEKTTRSAPVRLRRLVVPADRPKDWPAGDWEIVPAVELERLLKQTLPPAELPEQAALSRMEYTAVFADDMFQEGQWDATILQRDPRRSLLELHPLNLALHELAWVDESRPNAPKTQPARWGTLPAGTTAVLIPAVSARNTEAVRQLTGRWSLSGRKRVFGTEFDLKLPAATSARLTLDLPPGYRLTSTAGFISSPESEDTTEPAPTADIKPQVNAGSDTSPADNRWQIELGGETAVQIVVLPPLTTAAPKSAWTVCTQEMTWLIRETESRLQAKFDVQVFDRSVDQLVVEIPAELSVTQVTYGGEPVHSWRVVTPSRRNAKLPRRLIISFADELLGQCRPLRLTATATVPLGELWTAAAPKISGAHVMAEQLHLGLEPPLELRDLATRGYRQLGVADEPARTLWTFDRFRLNSKLTATFARPQTLFGCHVSNWLDTRPDRWELWSELRWDADNDSLFALECDLDDNWEVADVTGASADRVSYWNIETTREGQRRLHVELRQPLERGKPLTLQVRCRFLPTTTTSAPGLPILRPNGCRAVSQTYAVTAGAKQWLSDALPAELAAVVIPAPEASAIMALPFQQMQQEFLSPVWLKFSSIDRRVKLPLGDANDSVSATAVVRISEVDGRIVETCVLDITPGANPVEQLDLSLYDAQAPWFLEAVVPVDRPLMMQRMTDDDTVIEIDPANGDVRLPGGDSVNQRSRVRLLLPQAMSQPFRLTSQRTRDCLPNGCRCQMPVVSAARRFRGEVVVDAAVVVLDEQSLQRTKITESTDDHEDPAAAEKPAEPSDDNAVNSELQPAKKFAYSTPEAALRVRASTREKPTEQLTDSRTFAVLHLSSLVSPGNGRDMLHRARYTLRSTTESFDVEYRLPTGLRLLSCKVNGETRFLPDRSADTPDSGKESRPATDRIRLSGSKGSSQTLEFRFATAPASSALWSHVTIPLPQLSIPVIQTNWKLAAAGDTAILCEPEHFSLAETASSRSASAAALSWSQRLFGPLGKPAQTVANRSADETNDVAAGARVPADWPGADSEWATIDGAPAGVQQWEAEAMGGFDRIDLELWSPARARRIAWLALCVSLSISVLMRAGLVRQPVRWIACCLAVMVAAALTAPPPVAFLCGGLISGVLLAVTLPRFLFETAAPENESALRRAAIGSTASYRRAPVAGLLLACAAAAWGASHAVLLAQSPQPRATSETAPASSSAGNSAQPTDTGPVISLPVFDVLVPVDRVRPQAVSEVVYVDRSRLKQLRERANALQPPAHPAWLIRSAMYEITLDEHEMPTMTATWEVFSRAGSRFGVELPMSGVNLLGRRSCRVNNRPAFADLRRDGAGYIVEVASEVSSFGAKPAQQPARAESRGLGAFSAQHTIRMEFQLQAARANSVSFGVPAVADTIVRVRIDRKQAGMTVPAVKNWQTIEVNGHKYRQQRFGGTSRVEIDWQDVFAPADPAAVLPASRGRAFEATVNAPILVTVHPLFKRFHVRLHGRLSSGELKGFEVALPRSAWIEDLTGPGIAAVTTRVDAKKRRQLVELAKPLRGAFSYDLIYRIPRREAGASVMITPDDLPALGTLDGQPLELSHSIGIASLAEFEIHPLTLADNTDWQVQATSMPPERLLAEFRANDSEDKTLTKPQFAYAFTPPHAMRFTQEERPTSQNVRWRFQGHVENDWLQWTATADLSIQGTPLFFQQLIVPRELEIESISLTQDEVSRLVRWTRFGSRVLLTLSDNTAKTPRLEVRGRMRLLPDEDRSLPLLKLQKSDVQSAVLEMTRTKLVEVELCGLGNEDLDRSVLPVVGTGAARFPLATSDEVPGIRVLPKDERLTVNTLFVAAGESLTDPVACYLHIRNTGLQPEPIQFELPAHAEVDTVHAVSMGELSARPCQLRSTPAGRTLVTIDQLLAAGEEVTLVFTPRARTVEGGGRIQLTWPVVRHAGNRSRMVSLPVQGSLAVTPGFATSVPATTLQPWLTRIPNLPSQPTAWRAVSAAERLELTTAHRQQAESRVRYAQTRAHIAADGSVRGRSVFYLANTRTSYAVSLPNRVQVTAVLLNGEPIDWQAPADGQRMELKGVVGRSEALLTIDWFRRNSESNGVVDRLELVPLRIEDIAAAEPHLFVSAGSRSRLIAEADDPEAAFLATLERVEQQLSVISSATPRLSPPAARAFWVELQTTIPRLRQLWTAGRSDGNARVSREDQRTRYESALRRARTLRPPTTFRSEERAEHIEATPATDSLQVPESDAFVLAAVSEPRILPCSLRVETPASALNSTAVFWVLPKSTEAVIVGVVLLVLLYPVLAKVIAARWWQSLLSTAMIPSLLVLLVFSVGGGHNIVLAALVVTTCLWGGWAWQRQRNATLELPVR